MKAKLNLFPIGVQLSVFISIWVALMMITLFLQAELIPLILNIPKEQFVNNMLQFPQGVLLGNLFYQLLGFGIPVLLFGFLWNGHPVEFAGMSNKKIYAPVILLSAGVVLVLFIGSMGGLIQQADLGEWADRLQSSRDEQLAGYLRNSNAIQLIVNIICMALVPAICEELFFRGAVMKFMLGFKLKPIIAFISTSVFFTLLHGSVYQFIPIFTASMILCFVYYFTGNLINSIILHFLNNGIQILVQSFSTDVTGETTAPIYVQLGLFVITGIAMYMLMQHIYKHRKTDNQLWVVQQTGSN